MKGWGNMEKKVIKGRKGFWIEWLCVFPICFIFSSLEYFNVISEVAFYVFLFLMLAVELLIRKHFVIFEYEMDKSMRIIQFILFLICLSPWLVIKPITWFIGLF